VRSLRGELVKGGSIPPTPLATILGFVEIRLCLSK
jgi:hypothetical protein